MDDPNAITMMKYALALPLLMLASTATAQSFPTINIKQYCFEQAYNGGGGMITQRCVDDEIKAADQLYASWAITPSSIRSICLPPPPSQSQPERMTGAYQYILHCIQRRRP